MTTVINSAGDGLLRAVRPEDYDQMPLNELFAPLSATVIPASKLWTISGNHMSPKAAAYSTRRAHVSTRSKGKGR
jgi:hypothetical protein